MVDNILANAQSKAENIKRLKFQLSCSKNCLMKRFIMISLCNLSSHIISLVTISPDYWFYVHHVQCTGMSIEAVFSAEAMVRGYTYCVPECF